MDGLGYRYPVGKPTYFKGSIPKEALADDKYYFVHVRTRFYIKEGMLPTIQIKGDPRYYSREWLTTSDVKGTDGRYRKYTKAWGKIEQAIPDLYLTMTDWEMLQEHYNLEDTKIIDGFYFDTEIGMFDNYITKYAKLKIEDKQRKQIWKLMLNNLYGRLAQAPDNIYKVFYLNDEGVLKSYLMEGKSKKPGYIACGAAITSYARQFTISAAQKNMGKINVNGEMVSRFAYSDTDSIHMVGESEDVQGCPKHPSAFCHWKYETTWDFAKFVRAKTYVEHVIAEDEEPVESPYYNLKCAGMSQPVKDLFLHSVQQDLTDEEKDELKKDERAFVEVKRSFEDFKEGLEIPGMLKSKQIPGGTLLVRSPYKMRPAWCLGNN